jgi:hypothetical protein
MPLEELSPYYPQLNEEGVPVPDHYLVHKPIDCPSSNHKSYQSSSFEGQERFYDAGLREDTYKWCSNCVVPKNES